MDITSYLLGKKSSSGGGGGLDWSAIGYSDTPQSIKDGYNYAKQIYDNWDSSKTTMNSEYSSNKTIVIMPLVDTKNVTNMVYTFNKCYGLLECPMLDTQNVTTMKSMFGDCYSLRKIPQFNTSKITTMQNMFTDCYSLTDESLNNILKMCININSNYSRTKSLTELGFNILNYSASRIQALPSYQDFIDAGWTIGY